MIHLNDKEKIGASNSQEKLFWQSKLNESSMSNTFPYDLTPVNQPQYIKGERRLQIPQGIAEKLFSIGNDSDTAIFMIVLSGVMFVLSRYIGRSDVTVAIPVFKSSDKGVTASKYIAIHNKIQLENGFKNELLGIRAAVSEAIENENYPLETFISSVNHTYGKYLLPTLVGFNSIHNIDDLEHASTDTVFSFCRIENALELRLNYNAALYTESRMESITRNWISFMEKALKQPDQKLMQIALVEEKEENRLIRQFNDTYKAYDQQLMLTHWLEEQAQKLPNQTAVFFGTESLTYAALNAKANQLARTLIEQGVKPDQPVAILAERSFSMIIGIWAILKAGGAYLPIDPSYPLDRICFILEDSGVKLLLTQNENSEIIQAINKNVLLVNLESEANYHKEDTNFTTDANSRHLAYIIYTSGSTGLPKGVMVEHRSVINRLQWMQNQYPLTTNDIILQKTPFTFDVSVWELFWWSAVGASVSLLMPGAEKDPQEIVEAMTSQRITVMHFVPSMLSLFLEHLKDQEKPKFLQHLKTVFTSGEALQVQQVERFERLVHHNAGTKLVNLYGPTEATIDVTYFDCLQHSLTNSVPIGRPIDNIQLYIVNEEFQLQPIGVAGELCIAGDGVARGYLQRRELNEEKFIANPFEPEERMYRTGDLACWLPDGNIEYLGRLDHQVKIRGFRIECGEIEHRLLNHTDIREAVVAAKVDAKGDKYLCAYIVCERHVSTLELNEYLSSQLPSYMIPAYYVQLEFIPLTPNGKTDRSKLPDPAKQVSINGTNHLLINELEQKIAKIWASELGNENVGWDDHFFLMGGDSIKVIRLVSQINKTFQIQIKSRDFYKEPTFRQLVRLISAQKTEEYSQEWLNGMAVISRLKENIINDPNQANALPEDWEDFYPLSSIQQSMVFYSRLKPEEPIYHDQFCYQFDINKFNAHLFQEALQCLIQKHPSLRTTFHLSKFSEPIQVVHKHAVPSYIFENISFKSIVEQENYLKLKMEEDLIVKYKFDHELLWRMQLYQVHEHSYCMILSFHHAVLDGWSVASFIKEFTEVYSRLSLGEVIDVELLKSSYKDYMALQIIRKSSEETIQFWKERMGDYTRNKLPFNFSNKKLQHGHTNKILRKSMDNLFLQALEQRAKSLNCTLMELCLGAHLYLLSILTTEHDVITGLVTHDRPDLIDSEQVLGCFLNTIPFRQRVEKQLNKQAFLEQIGISLRKAKPHELFLADIAAATGERNQKENPFFDVIFNFIDMHVLKSVHTTNDTPIAETTHELLVQSNEMTNTLFDLEVSKTLNRLDIQLKYSPNFFYDSEMQSAFDLFIRILEQFVSDGDTIHYRDCLLEAQTEKSLYTFNQTQGDYPKESTLHSLFEDQALKMPNQIALTYEGQHLTYRELDQRSNQVARLLLQQGVKLNDHVGILFQRGMDMVVSMMAILKCGAAYVPIDPEFPQNRIEYIIGNAQISLIITDQDFESAQTVVTLKLEPELVYSQITDPIDSKKISSELAYIIYTSGSTGMPKGVMIEHHSAVNLVLWVNKQFNISEKDCLLFITSMCFDLSVYDVFGILAAGGRVVIVKRSQVQSPSQLKKLIELENITFWDSVPTTMNHFIQLLEETDPNYQQHTLRLVFLSGDWIPVGLPDRIHNYFPQTEIISLGGATEATVWSNYYPIEQIDPLQSSIPYGKPIANNYFYILDESLNPLPEGVAGELFIGGVGVARGYMGDSRRSEQAFLPNPFLAESSERMYKTGDLGRMLPDGNMEFLGRKDHQVKIRGFRVELGEIESQLAKLDYIKEACVIDVTDANQTNYLCAYVVADREILLSEVKEKLLKVLPGYMIPSVVMQIPKLPLTSNGKIDRPALPEPVAIRDETKNYEPPRNEMDIKLLNIWKSILNVEQIGILDNFFEIGGHSLLAVKMEIEMEKLAAASMDMFAYEYQTIKEQSDFLEEMILNKMNEQPVEVRSE